MAETRDPDTSTTTNDLLRAISSKLDKLDKLDSLDVKLDGIGQDVKEIKASTSNLGEIGRDVKEIKASTTTLAKDLRDAKATSATRDRKLESRVSKLETDVAILKRKR